MKAENKRQNPFFLPYGTPHDTAPFDRITLEDYEEAMMEGIRRDDEQIEKIINNPEKPTFDNTIINVDDEKDDNGYYDLLSRVSSVFFSGHRTGKGQFSFQSQRKAMPKNAQTTAQLH